jgi:hypothetical protein
MQREPIHELELVEIEFGGMEFPRCEIVETTMQIFVTIFRPWT